MKIETLKFAGYTLLAAMVASAPAIAQEAPGKLYNTAKQKLLDGKQIFSVTISKPDAAAYCEAAKHYDYTWFEMQHSTLTWADIEKMVAACPHSVATPMVAFRMNWKARFSTPPILVCSGSSCPHSIRSRKLKPPSSMPSIRRRAAAAWVRVKPRGSGRAKAKPPP